jgi:hypothetical protein
VGKGLFFAPLQGWTRHDAHSTRRSRVLSARSGPKPPPTSTTRPSTCFSRAMYTVRIVTLRFPPGNRSSPAFSTPAFCSGGDLFSIFFGDWRRRLGLTDCFWAVNTVADRGMTVVPIGTSKKHEETRNVVLQIQYPHLSTSSKVLGSEAMTI